jgi:hypothetical protein
MRQYVPTSTNVHGCEEELQWVRILQKGDPASGMALVVMQKLCTAFHEFDPAWRAGTLKEGQLEYFRGRLAGRARRVLDLLEKNGLSNLAGVAELRDVLAGIRSATSMGELANLAEPVHKIGHTLCEALEKA